MLTLALAAIPAEIVKGIYGPNKDQMPARMRFLYPAVARGFYLITDRVVVSDMFRSPESSLAAVKAGRGAMPPGFSGHNYGLSIDVDVAASIKRSGVANKERLDAFMEAHGFYCHRRDHRIASEAWHYNYLGAGTVISPKVQSTSGYIEAAIIKLYGDALKPDDTECQRLLKKLVIYSGEADGVIGPISKAAINVFRRGWGLGDGTLDAKTRRTLAYVACVRT